MNSPFGDTAHRRGASRCSPQHDLFGISDSEQGIEDNLQEIFQKIDQEPEVVWDEQEVVRLHWLLLQKLDGLQDPHTPLDEKFELVRWVFTDRQHDQMPFSFASCLEVVGASPLSPTAYFGKLAIDDIRDWIASNLSVWMRVTLQAYPAWVQSEIRHHPDWVAQQLDKNPQWINQRMKNASVQTDLFS